MLEKIQSPADLRGLTDGQLRSLAEEIRSRLVDTVSRNGGHLASNLGAVELTIALHLALDTPRDRLVFDVGHQCYTHKLLTGRQDLLETLRTPGGVSGFPKRSESPYDCFDTGHASTAISAAVGMARARDLSGEDYAVAVLVGDGAMTGGLCYEAMNDVGSRPTPLIVVLNDNKMSIAPNAGALSKHLTRLRGSVRWNRTKHTVKSGLERVPLVGAPVLRMLNRGQRVLHAAFLHGSIFEALGFKYLGPVDGHDIPTLVRTIRAARALERPVLIHAVTVKGCGFTRAEQHPEAYHGVAPFFIESGKSRSVSDGTHVSAAAEAGAALSELAAGDPRVVAVTAAMPQGTGLSGFAERFPDRFFDVGIAESHAATFCAGLAAGGMRPFFAVYATFLSRAADQLLHDVCLQGLPVTVLADHAGFVPGDGATHQGVYDLGMLRAMPGLTVWQPADAEELRAMIRASRSLEGPCVIRYPKSLPRSLGTPFAPGSWRLLRPGDDLQLVAVGRACETALEAARILSAQGVQASVWSASSLPADPPPLAPRYAVVEECAGGGGLGEALSAYAPPLRVFGCGSTVPSQEDLPHLDAQCGMTADAIAAALAKPYGGRA